MTTRVIGLGQRAAGDDGVGLAVVDLLRVQGVPDGVSLETVAEPSALVEPCGGPEPVILVDAVVGGGAAGDVLVLSPADLDAAAGARAVSTHSLSVGQALGLAAALSPDGAHAPVRIVAVVIDPPSRGLFGLGPAARAAVPRAAAAIRALLAGGA